MASDGEVDDGNLSETLEETIKEQQARAKRRRHPLTALRSGGVRKRRGAESWLECTVARVERHLRDEEPLTCDKNTAHEYIWTYVLREELRRRCPRSAQGYKQTRECLFALRIELGPERCQQLYDAEEARLAAANSQ